MTDALDVSGIWFSYVQKRYKAKEYRWEWVKKILPRKRFFEWSKEPERWDWHDCEPSVVGMENGQARLAIRRKKILQRSSPELGSEVNLMLGFVITDVAEPEFGHYPEPPPHNDERKVYGKECTRWFIRLKTAEEGKPETRISDCIIWKWSDNPNVVEKDIKEIYDTLVKKKGELEPDKGIFRVSTKPYGTIVPTIYQPRIDAWKNFIRAVYLYEQEGKIECNIVFNDEQLRVSWIFEAFYRWYRRRKFGRVMDLESFNINLKNKSPETILFEGIYSGKHTLDDDYVHCDKKLSWPWPKPKSRPIKYFFSDKNHPIVFVNTSNHAMATHDNNHEFWKWEYVPGIAGSPVELDNMKKDDVDKMLKEKSKKNLYNF